MSLTVILLNWRRPQNIPPIVESLKNQTCKPKVWLIDNSGSLPPIQGVDMQVSVSANLACWPRWMYGTLVETECVASLDDDLMPADNAVFADAINVLQEYPHGTIVGYAGKVLEKGKEYKKCRDIHPWTANVRVDIVKGRTMLMRSDDLRAGMTAIQPATQWADVCDDIIISSMLNLDKQQRLHVVPTILKGRFRELSSEHALCGRPGHYERREATRRSWFTW